jgi:CheY-like chemotaxis protein
MLNETGCCNSARNPAAPGSIAALYATGEGQTTPPGVTGKVSDYDKAADYPTPQLPVSVTVGGEPAEIVFAGEAPHSMAGLLQVNFRVPANAPAGDAVPVVLSVGNSRSLDGVTMAIRSHVQRILAIDPDPASLRWLRRVLEGAGYQVAAAVDLAAAIRQAHEHPIDLVICSLTLPADQRREAIRTMQAERPQLKIVATAGQLGPRTLRNADLLGAQAVIAKPMASQAVLRRVRELLRPHPVPYEVH